MKKYIIISILTILILMSGCKKFLDINRDPDKTEDAPVENFLPGAQAAGLYAMRGNWQVIGAYWAQHWTQAPNSPQFQDYDRYQVGHSTFSRGYGTIFASGLKELDYIQKLSEKDQNWALYLISTCIKAYDYQILVDLFDKVPYTEALQGDLPGDLAISQPKFDEGSFIYDKLLESLDDALGKDFSSDGTLWPKDNDIIFKGDKDKWVRFANTMKLKLLLRKRYADNTVTNSLTTLLSEANFLTTENAGYNYFNNAPNEANTIFEINKEHSGNLSVSNTFVKYMYSKGDEKRLKAMANSSSEQSGYTSILQGDLLSPDLYKEDNDDPEMVNSEEVLIAKSIKDLTTPKLNYDDYQYYFTKAEVYFMLAEANLIIGNVGNAKINYEEGIKAHSSMIIANADDALTAANAVIYGHGSWGNFGTNEEKLEAIITQKWIASFNIMSLESFIEHSRTGYPDIFTVPVMNVTSGRFPHRFLIPQSEISDNSNTPDELKTAEIFDRVWWDKKN